MRLRVRCDGCLSDIVVDTRRLVLRSGAVDRYEFSCPECGTFERRPADHRVASTLIALGVACRVDPPPITERDIIAFMEHFDAEVRTLLEG